MELTLKAVKISDGWEGRVYYQGEMVRCTSDMAGPYPTVGQAMAGAASCAIGWSDEVVYQESQEPADRQLPEGYPTTS